VAAQGHRAEQGLQYRGVIGGQGSEVGGKTMIKQSDSLLHWNYFLALEADVERLARYVELVEQNFSTFSIEIGRLLQSACSEVDVLAHQLCVHFDPNTNAEKMDEYRCILRRQTPELETTIVQVPRYGLSLTPWSNWQSDRTPNWWSDHNKVKHRRTENFGRANIKNLLNASAGSLLLTVCFYRLTTDVKFLDPPPTLFKPERSFAPIELVLGRGAVLSVYPE